MKYALLLLAVIAAVILWSRVDARYRTKPMETAAAVTASAAETKPTGAVKKAAKAPRPKAPIYAY